MWYGDWENGGCDAHAIDPITLKPRVLYHGTSRKFDEFDNPNLTPSIQGVKDIDNIATFFDNSRSASYYALNLEDQMQSVIATIAQQLKIDSWSGALEKWSEIMHLVFNSSDAAKRIKIDDGLLYIDNQTAIDSLSVAGYFSESDLLRPSECGTKVLHPHTDFMQKVAANGIAVLVPNWFNPRVVSAVVAFGNTDTQAAGMKLRQNEGHDNQHLIGLIKHDVDTVVVGTELGLQFSVKDKNRIHIIGSRSMNPL